MMFNALIKLLNLKFVKKDFIYLRSIRLCIDIIIGLKVSFNDILLKFKLDINLKSYVNNPYLCFFDDYNYKLKGSPDFYKKIEIISNSLVNMCDNFNIECILNYEYMEVLEELFYFLGIYEKLYKIYQKKKRRKELKKKRKIKKEEKKRKKAKKIKEENKKRKLFFKENKAKINLFKDNYIKFRSAILEEKQKECESRNQIENYFFLKFGKKRLKSGKNFLKSGKKRFLDLFKIKNDTKKELYDEKEKIKKKINIKNLFKKVYSKKKKKFIQKLF